MLENRIKGKNTCKKLFKQLNLSDFLFLHLSENFSDGNLGAQNEKRENYPYFFGNLFLTIKFISTYFNTVAIKYIKNMK